jgi:hypothetical protein
MLVGEHRKRKVESGSVVTKASKISLLVGGLKIALWKKYK